MSVLNYININFLNPLQSIPAQWYLSLKNNFKALPKDHQKYQIIVSLTSFPARFKTLHLVIKSILNQKLKPNIILICLSRDEVNNESELPQKVLELKKYGLQIVFTGTNLKPHNKYYYTMKNFHDSVIITIDDDNIYDRNLILSLYNSFIKFPEAISAKRVHKITYDTNGELLPYSKWKYEYKKEIKPSFDLLATGVGGVLYPPGIMPEEIFNIKKISELCLNADDIWLKFMELLNKIPVVWVKSKRIHPLNIKSAQKITLQKNNYHNNLNDIYIQKMQNHYKVYLSSFLK